MLGFRESMQDVVYLQHIAPVERPPDLTEGPRRRCHRVRLWSNGVIAFDPPGFGMRVGDPSLPRRESHDRLHIGARVRRHRDVVDMKAVDDGRVHRVGRGKAPEQEGSAPAESGSRMRPGGFDTSDIRLYLIAKRDGLDGPAKIRRTRLP